MEIEINIEKKNFVFLVVLTLFFVGLILVVAQTPNPGHDASRISGVCRTNGLGCPGCFQDGDGLLYYHPDIYNDCDDLSGGMRSGVFCATNDGGVTTQFTMFYAQPGTFYGYQTNQYLPPINCGWVICKDGN